MPHDYTHLKRNRDLWVLPLLGLLAFVFAVASSFKYGAGISPDSVSYLSTARNLVAGNGYRVYEGSYYSLWPPLYPSILACFELLKINSVAGIYYLQSVIFAIIVVLSYRIFKAQIRHRILARVGILAVILSVPLLEVTIMLWSELIFAFLILLSALRLVSYLENDQFSELLILTGLISAACMQRYAGIGFVIACCCILFFIPNKKPFSKRLFSTSFFGITSIIPLSLWMIRNYHLTSTLTGPRWITASRHLENVKDVCNVLSMWILPKAIPLSIRLVILLGLVAWALWIIGKRKYFGDQRELMKTNMMKVSVCFSVVYIVFITMTLSGSFLDGISSRFLVPVYIFLLLILLVGIDMLLDSAVHVKLKKISLDKLMVAMVCCLLCYPLVWTVHKFVIWNALGVGYSGKPWIASPAVAWLKNNPDTSQLFTNDAAGIYYQCGLVVPEMYCRFVPIPDNVKTQIESGKCRIIWFQCDARPHLYSFNELEQWFEFEQLLAFHDATVYRIKGKSEKSLY
jgi:hypothetical protein